MRSNVKIYLKELCPIFVPKFYLLLDISSYLFDPEVDTRREQYVRQAPHITRSKTHKGKGKKRGFLGRVRPRGVQFDDDHDDRVEAEHDVEIDDAMHEAEATDIKLSSFLTEVQDFLEDMSATDIISPVNRKNKEPSSPARAERASSSSGGIAIYESPIAERPKAKAKAKAKAETKPDPNDDEPEVVKVKPKPVKKDTAATKSRAGFQKGYEKFHRDTFTDWIKENKQELWYQATFRPSIMDKFNAKKLGRMNKTQLSNLLVEADKIK